MSPFWSQVRRRSWSDFRKSPPGAGYGGFENQLKIIFNCFHQEGQDSKIFVCNKKTGRI